MPIPSSVSYSLVFDVQYPMFVGGNVKLSYNIQSNEKTWISLMANNTIEKQKNTEMPPQCSFDMQFYI